MGPSLKPELDFKKISFAFAQYNLGTIEKHSQIEGDVDINYKLITTSGNYLLKYIENKVNIPHFKILGSLYKYLREKGIPVPEIYKTKNNNYVENDFILYEFIEGEIKDKWSKEEMISLVSNFVSMLIALKGYTVPDFIKQKEPKSKYAKGYDMRYCYEVFRPEILKLSTSEKIKTQIVKTIDLLYGKLDDFEKLPKFIIHGDLNEMNAIFKNGKNVGIIDFGMSYDPIVYDLGEFCYWFTMPLWTEEFNNERYNLIVETFSKILPLSKSEKELLPCMMLRRGMMDLMLTLQWYWSHAPVVAVPEKRLALLIRRNNKIINLIL